MQQFPVSKYQPIWNQLKAEGICRIVASPLLHRRIKKAVIKRKDEDLGFKLTLAETGKYAKLNVTIEGNTVIFSLTYYTLFDSIGAY